MFGGQHQVMKRHGAERVGWTQSRDRRRQKTRPAEGCSRAGAGVCLIEKKKDAKT